MVIGRYLSVKGSRSGSGAIIGRAVRSDSLHHPDRESPRGFAKEMRFRTVRASRPGRPRETEDSCPTGRGFDDRCLS